MLPMVVCGTGHRPDKLNREYDLKGPLTKSIAEEVYKAFDAVKPDVVISGMALGFDMIIAICAIKKGIKLHAAVPFAGQEKKWPEESQKLYNGILRRAGEVTIVCEGGYAAYKMQHRNQWMVDNSEKVIACWDGSDGGTKNCVDYVLKFPKKEIIRIDPKKLTRMMLK